MPHMLAGLFLLVATHSVLSQTAVEPMQNGRPLSFWTRQMLTDGDNTKRHQAAVIIEEMGVRAKPAIPDLIRALKDSFYAVRWSAARALGKIGPEAGDAVPSLNQLLLDPDRGVQAEACGALWYIARDSSVIKHLAQTVENGGILERNAAVRVLGEIGPPAKSAVNALIRALDDKNACGTAAQALARIGPDAAAAVPGLRTLMRNGNVRGDDNAMAALALGSIGSAAKAALPDLLAQVHDEKTYFDTRRNAAISIAEIQGREGIALLRQLMRSERSSLRQIASSAVGHLAPGAKEVIDDLTKALGDMHASVRIAAAQSLGKFGPAARPALPTLNRLKQDSDDQVRRATEEAIRMIDRP